MYQTEIKFLKNNKSILLDLYYFFFFLKKLKEFSLIIKNKKHFYNITSVDTLLKS